MKYPDYPLMSKEKKNTMTPRLRFPEFREAGEWEEPTLSEISERIDEKVGDLLLTTVSITAGSGFVAQAEKFGRDISGEQYKNYIILKEGEFAYNKGNSKRYPQGCIYKLREFKQAAAPNAFICFRFKRNYVADFFQGYFDNNYHGKQLQKFITSGARSDGLLNISPDDFFSIKLPTPTTKAEQQKIAATLTSLDDLIAAQSEKIKALQAHKKGLMQQLFPAEGEMVPRLRFKEFEGAGKWEIRQLNEFITERNQFSINKLPLYSLTIENGITPKTERYERSFLVRDEEEAYKLVCPNDFAYNPMNLRFGAIARHAGNNKVAVSKYYNIFYCDDSVDSIFCEFYFKSYGMISFYDDVATGSLIEKRRVHFSDFLRFNIHFPKLEEQQKIAACLISLDNLIAAQSEKLEALKAHKKGLIQQLFPNPNEA
ncbi:MAG: restriction endonuclease subunit S [Saprospiraceae bacterium]|nr:restriction endonuclease subunit S [Saprospiraceae bacterium]